MCFLPDESIVLFVSLLLVASLLVSLLLVSLLLVMFVYNIVSFNVMVILDSKSVTDAFKPIFTSFCFQIVERIV